MSASGESIGRDTGEKIKKGRLGKASQVTVEEELDEMSGANMNTRQIHQHLKKYGWKLNRTSGGHDVYTHEKAKHHIAVPRHKDLKAPLVLGILKASKQLNELTGDETTASIGDQKEDELKKKGISLNYFKKRNYI
jgi:predicted RNA binding protein YcfA (HicA-like mRNA interferase family)